MHDLTVGRDPRLSSNLEASAQNSGDAPQAATSEQFRQVSHLDRLRSGGPGNGGEREGRRQGARGAHPEPLPDGEFVLQSYDQGSRGIRP